MERQEVLGWARYEGMKEKTGLYGVVGGYIYDVIGMPPTAPTSPDGKLLAYDLPTHDCVENRNYTNLSKGCHIIYARSEDIMNTNATLSNSTCKRPIPKCFVCKRPKPKHEHRSQSNSNQYASV